jgi:hypothetical protein
MRSIRRGNKFAYSTYYYAALILLSVISCTHKNGHADVKVSAPVTAVDTNLKWVEYHIGELPPQGYYATFDSVIKKWKIRYQRIEGGCEELPAERNKYEKDNPRYFKILERKYGKGWLKGFYADVKALEEQSQKK